MSSGQWNKIRRNRTVSEWKCVRRPTWYPTSSVIVIVSLILSLVSVSLLHNYCRWKIQFIFILCAMEIYVDFWIAFDDLYLLNNGLWYLHPSIDPGFDLRTLWTLKTTTLAWWKWTQNFVSMVARQRFYGITRWADP